MLPDKGTIFVFTGGFPCDAKSEPFLLDELPALAASFSRVYFLPQQGSVPIYKLPENCEVIAPPDRLTKVPGIRKHFVAASWLSSDFFKMLKKGIFLKIWRYNYSLMLSLFSKASYYQKIMETKAEGKIYLYSYWSNECLSIAALIKSRWPKITVFSRAHGFDVFEEQTRYQFIPFRSRQLRHASAVFSVSKRGCERLIDRNPRYSNKIKLAYLGTADHGLAPFNENEKVVVSCAYLRRLKGVEFIPDALMHIKTPVTWVHIGDGELMEEIRTKCKSLPGHIKVELVGTFLPEEIQQFYLSRSVSLFLSLSEREGLPVTLMEAISYGIPIMATDVGGCCEITTEETGTLLEEHPAAETVAGKMEAFLSSKKNSIDFRGGVREFWRKRFSADVNYQKFYQEVKLLKA